MKCLDDPNITELLSGHVYEECGRVITISYDTEEKGVINFVSQRDEQKEARMNRISIHLKNIYGADLVLVPIPSNQAHHSNELYRCMRDAYVKSEDMDRELHLDCPEDMNDNDLEYFRSYISVPHDRPHRFPKIKIRFLYTDNKLQYFYIQKSPEEFPETITAEMNHIATPKSNLILFEGRFNSEDMPSNYYSTIHCSDIAWEYIRFAIQESFANVNIMENPVFFYLDRPASYLIPEVQSSPDRYRDLQFLRPYQEGWDELTVDDWTIDFKHYIKGKPELVYLNMDPTSYKMNPIYGHRFVVEVFDPETKDKRTLYTDNSRLIVSMTSAGALISSTDLRAKTMCFFYSPREEILGFYPIEK